MSALWFRIYDGMVARGSASLAGIDGCHARGLLTDDEHEQLIAKWRTANETPTTAGETPPTAAVDG